MSINASVSPYFTLSLFLRSVDLKTGRRKEQKSMMCTKASETIPPFSLPFVPFLFFKSTEFWGGGKWGGRELEDKQRPHRHPPILVSFIARSAVEEGWNLNVTTIIWGVTLECLLLATSSISALLKKQLQAQSVQLHVLWAINIFKKIDILYAQCHLP